jgi:hypothetical protein
MYRSQNISCFSLQSITIIAALTRLLVFEGQFSAWNSLNLKDYIRGVSNERI